MIRLLPRQRIKKVSPLNRTAKGKTWVLSGIVLQRPRVLLDEVPAPFIYSVLDEEGGQGQHGACL